MAEDDGGRCDIRDFRFGPFRLLFPLSFSASSASQRIHLPSLFNFRAKKRRKTDDAPSGTELLRASLTWPFYPPSNNLIGFVKPICFISTFIRFGFRTWVKIIPFHSSAFKFRALLVLVLWFHFGAI